MPDQRVNGLPEKVKMACPACLPDPARRHPLAGRGVYKPRGEWGAHYSVKGGQCGTWHPHWPGI